MKKLLNSVTMHVNINKDVLEAFDKLYPTCRRRFTERCLALAIEDNLFFERVFFNHLLKNDNNLHNV